MATAAPSARLLFAAKSVIQVTVLLGIGVWATPLYSGAVKSILKLATSEDYAAAKYTGIWALDIIMAFHRAAFLITSADAPTPRTLHELHYFGSIGPLWLVMILETCRRKPFAQVLSHTLKWGFTCMVLGPQLIMPFYYVVNFPDGRPETHIAVVDNEYLITDLPALVTLFFLLPIFLVQLPASYAFPDVIKVHLVMVLMCWPGWLSGTAYLLQRWRGSPCAPATYRSVSQHLRSGYVFSFYVALVFHVGTIIWCLSLGEAPGPAMRAMFVPLAPWADRLTSDHQEIITFFTKSAEVTCSTSAGVWALVSYLQTCQQRGKIPMGLSKIVLRMAGTAIICGPYAAAIQLLIWKHDVLSDDQAK